jgi:hypothetical protein
MEAGMKCPGTSTRTRRRNALDLASELGMRLLAAHCHVGLGKLYRRTGKRREAQEHLSTATTHYREMDMRIWLEQAEGDGEGARYEDNGQL